MTENEAIKELSYDNTAYGGKCTEEVRRVAIHALSEIQQYRAIGTVEEFRAYKQGDCMNNCEHYDNCSNYIYSKGYNKAIDEFAEKMKDYIAKNVEDAEVSNDLWCEICQSEIDDMAEQMKGE